MKRDAAPLEVPRHVPDDALARPAEHLRDLLVRQTLAVERHRAAIAHQLGIGDTELSALVALTRHEELTPGALRERLALSSGGTTALIQRLERAGHVRRSRHPKDRRSAVVSITRETRALVAALAAPLLDAMDQAADALSPSERATIGAWLDRVVHATEAEATDVAGQDGRAPDVVPDAWL